MVRAMALTGRKILGRSLSILFLGSVVFNCAAVNNAANKAGVPGAPKCPDMTNVDAILDFDWAGNFKVNAEAGGKLKAGAAAAISVKGFADQIDADLSSACQQISKDLGGAGTEKGGEASCKAAIKLVGDVKAKLGANAKFALTFQEPKCHADMNVMAQCSGKCDAKVSGGSAKVECEPGKLSGTCDADCSGSCDMSASAKCDGECHGTCDANIKGTCSGKCNGKCDGKATTGGASGASCAGTCEGKCDAQVQAECTGKCGGSCKLKAKAKCEGTCNGDCSVQMKAPKCNGEVKPPEMSADCKASCNAHMESKMDCTPAKVGYVITGAADAKLAATLQGTIEKNFPLILKVAVGMGERAIKTAGEAATAVTDVSGSIDVIAKTSANPALTTGAITACVAEPFKAAGSAAAGMKANVNVSFEAKASVSGSAKGSAGGKT